MRECGMRKSVGRLLLAVVCLLCMSGCAGKDVKEPEREFIIGGVTKSRNSEYWMSVNAGMEKAAKEMNVKTVILSPDTETDKKIQKKMIRDLLKMKVDALAVSPIICRLRNWGFRYTLMTRLLRMWRCPILALTMKR